MDPSATETAPRSRWPKYLGFGCLAVIVVLAAGGVLAYYGLRSAVGSLLAEYSSEERIPLPTVSLPAAETAAIEKRIREFGDAVDDGQPTAPLVLTEDELNAVVQGMLSREKVAERGVTAHIRIVGSRLEADVSIPLKNFEEDLRDRYLNGKARLSTEVEGDRLVAHLEDLKVGDHYVPDVVRERISRENLLKDAYDDPKTHRLLTGLQSIEIGDGKIVLKPRNRSSN